MQVQELQRALSSISGHPLTRLVGAMQQRQRKTEANVAAVATELERLHQRLDKLDGQVVPDSQRPSLQERSQEPLFPLQDPLTKVLITELRQIIEGLSVKDPKHSEGPTSDYQLVKTLLGEFYQQNSARVFGEFALDTVLSKDLSPFSVSYQESEDFQAVLELLIADLPNHMGKSSAAKSIEFLQKVYTLATGAYLDAADLKPEAMKAKIKDLQPDLSRFLEGGANSVPKALATRLTTSEFHDYGAALISELFNNAHEISKMVDGARKDALTLNMNAFKSLFSQFRELGPRPEDETDAYGDLTYDPYDPISLALNSVSDFIEENTKEVEGRSAESFERLASLRTYTVNKQAQRKLAQEPEELVESMFNIVRNTAENTVKQVSEAGKYEQDLEDDLADDKLRLFRPAFLESIRGIYAIISDKYLSQARAQELLEFVQSSGPMKIDSQKESLLKKAKAYVKLPVAREVTKPVIEKIMLDKIIATLIYESLEFNVDQVVGVDQEALGLLKDFTRAWLDLPIHQ